MNRTSETISGPRRVFRLLAARAWLVLLPTVALTAAAAFYGTVTLPTWQASQALILRNEAANNDQGLGRFHSADEMKSLQGTILELAKNGGVLAAALKQVGPPAVAANRAWSIDRAVDALQDNVKVVPPKGVEFGTAEMFYLEVKDADRDRAIALDRAICDQLQARLQEIRDAKAQSMIGELDKTVHLAQADLQEATRQLSDLERSVGSDLAELRSLQESGSGDGSLRRTVSEIENELRQARIAQQASREMLGLLESAKADPGRLMAAPGRLLESQPALKRLKDGLVDAQLHTAQLQGRMSAIHPLVIAAKTAEEEISTHLHDELAIAIRGQETELRLTCDRTAMLEGQLAQTSGRLGRLAGLRASYVNLLAENAHRTHLVERAEQNLSDARASEASAKSASLIARIDAPDAGTRPIGPSRGMILLAGLVGGLAAGFGIVVLTLPASAPACVGSPDSLSIGAAKPQEGAHAVQAAASTRGTPGDSLLAELSEPPAIAPIGPLSLRQALKRINDRRPASQSASKG